MVRLRLYDRIYLLCSVLSSQIALKSLPESDLHCVEHSLHISLMKHLLKAEVFFYSIVIYISLHGKIDEYYKC